MITDELREWSKDRIFMGNGYAELTAIADRIDAEHESMVSYWQGASYKDGYDEGFASADDWLAQHEDAMAEHGWVKLPLGADGEPIHVGDVVIAQLPFGGESKPLVVDRMELGRGRDGDLWCVALDTDEGCWNQPSILRHYHEPTVEDVLREFADAWAEWKDGAAMMNPGEEYIAKLQLREGKMSITDELRKWGYGFCGDTHDVVTAIADRIDAEYESSYKDGYDEGAADILAFCDRLKEAAEGREDVTLWGIDYVALPVDADGEPWHIGDEIVNEHNAHVTVSEITYKGNGRWMLRAEPNLNFYAELARHYYPPTVEDVLREFANECLTYATCVDDHEVADAIELYAKRLRLVGEDE